LDAHIGIDAAINRPEVLKLCYEANFPDMTNKNIFISYPCPNGKIYNDYSNHVFRTKKERKEKDVIDDDSRIPNASFVYAFNHHNDSPDVFAGHYHYFKNHFPNCRFLEGISGASYNYNLLMNADIQALQYYRIIETCDIKIAIIDERIYNRYKNLKYGNGNTLTGEVDKKTIEKYNKEIILEADTNGETRVSKECFDYLYTYYLPLKGFFDEQDDTLQKRIDKVGKFIRAKGQIDTVEFYNRAFPEEKKVYIYNYVPETDKLIDLDGHEINKINEKIDYISVHYSILADKYKPEENVSIKKYRNFIEDFFLHSSEDWEEIKKMRAVIHSGKGGVANIDDEISFVTLSTIEACLEDCKYKLSQLFLNLKYQDIWNKS
jgi:hypothetical protein